MQFRTYIDIYTKGNDYRPVISALEKRGFAYDDLLGYCSGDITINFFPDEKRIEALLPHHVNLAGIEQLLPGHLSEEGRSVISAILDNVVAQQATDDLMRPVDLSLYSLKEQ